MRRVKINETELQYEINNSGEPVLFIHGAHIADGLRPLVTEPSLDHFQLIRYHRRGFAGSVSPAGPTSTEDQAGDAIGLLDQLGIERTHIVGYSYGAVIALTLAAAHPSRVQSLALLEPPLLAGPAGAGFVGALAPALERYDEGDKAGAVHRFLALMSPDWRAVIDHAVPGAIEQAEKDAARFFEVEFAAAGQWSFSTEQAAAITCPVLSLAGDASGPVFAEGRELLHTWFPQCEDADIAGATHFLQMEQPREVAMTIAAFLHKAQGNVSVPTSAGLQAAV